MSNDTVLYAELTPKEFRRRIAEAPIAYLPLGTLEWHGEHLPLGSDALISQGFFVELARTAGGIVLPPLFLGPDRRETIDGKVYYGMDNHAAEDGPRQLDGSAYWIDDEAFVQLLELILTHLKRAGFRMVVAHGHGPSNLAFAAHIDEWSKQLDLKLFTCWRDEETDGMGVQTDHAAANETSLVMALRPELVQMENLSADLNDKPVAVGGKDPRTDASRPTGQQIVRQHVDRMTKMLRQALAAT